MTQGKLYDWLCFLLEALIERPDLLNTAKSQPVILVIEDDIRQREIVTSILGLYSMQAVTMPDGGSGLHWLAEHMPDMVMLDLMLPDMSGLDVCHQIRKRFPQTELPVLMVSAAGYQVETCARSLAVGANDFMSKPYDLKELILRIQGLLNGDSKVQTAPSTLVSQPSSPGLISWQEKEVYANGPTIQHPMAD